MRCERAGLRAPWPCLKEEEEVGAGGLRGSGATTDAGVSGRCLLPFSSPPAGWTPTADPEPHLAHRPARPKRPLHARSPDCPRAAQRGRARSRAARLLVGAGRVTSRTPTPPSPWTATLGGVQGMCQGGEGSPGVVKGAQGWLQHRERGVRVKWVEARWASSRDAEAGGCKAAPRHRDAKRPTQTSSREGFFLPPPFRGYHVTHWTQAGGLASPNSPGVVGWASASVESGCRHPAPHQRPRPRSPRGKDDVPTALLLVSSHCSSNTFSHC